MQHLAFCERQCALIHIEQAWAENVFTAEGRILHERVHEADRESRGEVRIEYSMPLRSLRLGLIAKADVVKFHRKRERVQLSVFECSVDPAQWTRLRQRLIDEIESEEDSLRFYFLGANWRKRVEHIGTKKPDDPEGPLIV